MQARGGELEHEGLVGLLLLLVEPAGLVVRVELVIGIVQLADFAIQQCDCRVLVNQRQAMSPADELGDALDHERAKGGEILEAHPIADVIARAYHCLLYTSPSPRD